MKELTIYKVKDKTFYSKEEALKYEESLKDDLKTRARNLFLFWAKMIGYPGYSTAIELVNKFAGNHKFAFGQYKNKGIGEIIFLDRHYISWCLKNISTFKLSKREQILFDTDTSYSIGGSVTSFTRENGVESYYYDGDTYDNDLIDLEINWIKQKE